MAVAKRFHKIRTEVAGGKTLYHFVLWADVTVPQNGVYVDAARAVLAPAPSGAEVTAIRAGEVIERALVLALNPGETLSQLEARLDAIWNVWQAQVTAQLYPVIDDGAWRGTSAWSTSPSQPADVTPPVVSAIAPVNPLPDRITINFQTNEQATGQLLYGIATTGEAVFPSTPSPLGLVHSITPIGLVANQVYKCQIRAVDVPGNPTITTEFTFQTAQVLSGGAALPTDFVDTTLPGMTGTDRPVTNVTEFNNALAA